MLANCRFDARSQGRFQEPSNLNKPWPLALLRLHVTCQTVIWAFTLIHRTTTRVFCLLFTAVSVLLGGCERRPDASFEAITDAGVFVSSDHAGKVIYLDFWATWCAPCLQSFPWMTQMQEQYGDDGLVIIAASLDTDRRLVERFTSENPSGFTIAYDKGGKLADQFGVRAMPTAVLIDRKGRIAAQHAGFNDASKQDYEKKIVEVLAE